MVGVEIAIVEDDLYLACALQRVLRAAGHRSAIFRDLGEEELSILGAYALVILDIDLPRSSGLILANRLRRGSEIPIIMISGSTRPKIAVTALRSGGDDFLSKPFDPEELVERVNALVRRSGGRTLIQPTIVLPGYKFVAQERHIFDDQGNVVAALTERESAILAMLLSPVGALVTRERISRLVSGRDWTPYDRSVDVHVSNLRKKLKKAKVEILEILVIRNNGYVVQLRSQNSSPGELLS